MKLLFICKHNRFRSKVAEAIFLKLNKDKTIEVRSAGILMYLLNPYVALSVHEIMKEKGYKIENEQSERIDDYLINWADKIILVADNVSPDIFPKDKIEVWEIEDTDEDNKERIGEIIDEIEIKVKELIKRVKKKENI